jgi:glycosyltransferase involved in cell wall biosynthesis
MNQLVSIVIPLYNADKFLEETIDSVLAQTISNYEVFIIDDGSTDKSADKVKTYLSDNRFSYFYQKNSGVSIARNVGLNKATGEYILFLDADDVLTTNFIEARIAALENNPAAGCCGSEVIKIDEKGSVIEETEKAVSPGNNAIATILLYKENVSTIPSNLLLKTTILKQNKIVFNSNLSSTADRFFLLQFLQFSTCIRIDDAQVCYRVHSNSMSQKVSTKLFKDNLLYFRMINSFNLVPVSIKKECNALHYYILAGMAKQTNNYIYFLKFSLKTILFHPVFFFKKLF